MVTKDKMTGTKGRLGQNRKYPDNINHFDVPIVLHTKQRMSVMTIKVQLIWEKVENTLSVDTPNRIKTAASADRAISLVKILIESIVCIDKLFAMYFVHVSE